MCQRFRKGRLLIFLFLVLGINPGESPWAQTPGDKLELETSDEVFSKNSKAMGLYMRKNYHMAELGFKGIIEKNPRFSSAYIHIADCQLGLGKRGDAMKNYLKAYNLLEKKYESRMRLVPGAQEPEIFSDMVYCLNALGRYSDATLKGLMGTVAGESPDLFVNLAYTYYKMGKMDVSQRNYCKSRKMTEPGEIDNLTNQRITMLFEEGRQWTGGCREAFEGEGEGTNYALIIAVGKYRDPNINSLRYAENDAKKLYEVLSSPRTGLFKPENITVLTNEEATEKNIKFKFDDIVGKAHRKEDMVLVFYAGHGFTYENGTDTYWLTHDTLVGNREGNRIRSTAFSNLALATKISEIKANNFVFLIDACYSSGMLDKSSDIRGLDSYLGTGKDYTIITSSRSDQQSIESPKLKHGIFSYAITQGLAGAADQNHDGWVEIDELWPFVKKEVSGLAAKMGLQQNPVRSGSSGGAVHVSKNPDI